MQWTREHLTSAHLIAIIALFVALGGTSYAALKLPKRSVGAKHLKKNAVRSAQVKNRSLRKKDFKKGQLPRGKRGATGPQGIQGLQGIQGIQGLQGKQGEQGEQGETGSFGSVNVQVEQATSDIADGSLTTVDAFCLGGQTAIGGGVRGDADEPDETEIVASRPITNTLDGNLPGDNGTFTGWRAAVENPTGGTTTGLRPEVWVICATP
jgi:hypothetical protein